MLDLAIIGSGPAALTAAIYAARAGLKTVVYEKGAMGGALSQIAKIENYPGFVGAGADLAAVMRDQATTAGAKIEYGECQGVNPLIIDGEEIAARAILIATGSEPIPLDVKTDKPVSYCALCDGALYKGKAIAVIGGGNSAIQESIHLAKIVGSITVFSRSALSAEPYIIDKLKQCKNVTIRENITATPADLAHFAAVFTFIGKRPATTFLPSEILTKDGYIKTDDYATSINGIFAAGDVRDGSIRQAISAAADGAAAAITITKFLQK